ncbi:MULTISPECIES: chaperone modulator CbpM [unclassified Streptomyces]|uniref:chaperone modulator CbpM n=1 Tax=unclassified Streptomyces TaxID=2593676 RepID=UPI002E34CA04|nr:chaperone modulator CbpM [Streptomyces sp. NBC_01716]
MTPPPPRPARPRTRTVYALAPLPGLSLETVARRSGMHPDAVRKFVALGLLDARREASGRLRFAESAPLELARMERLRVGLCLNYAALGVVVDLLDRISRLETALRRRDTRSDQPPWT